MIDWDALKITEAPGEERSITKQVLARLELSQLLDLTHLLDLTPKIEGND